MVNTGDPTLKSASLEYPLMLEDLKRMIVDSRTLPTPKQAMRAGFGAQLEVFRKQFHGKGDLDLGPAEIISFLKRHRIFGELEDSLRRISKLDRVVTIIEGADATGKTSLAEALAKEAGGEWLENQAAGVFRLMFGLPKEYKIAAVDYNQNELIGLLFYIVVNTIAIRRAAELFESGASHVVLDSFFIRTLASNISRPDFSGDKYASVVIKWPSYRLITKELVPMVMDSLHRTAMSAFFVFLYMGEDERARQVKSRGSRDDYDTNIRYAEIINDFLESEQAEIRQLGINAMSITAIERDDLARWHGAREPMDKLFVRTGDSSSDCKRKAGLVLKTMRECGVYRGGTPH